MSGKLKDPLTDLLKYTPSNECPGIKHYPFLKSMSNAYNLV